MKYFDFIILALAPFFAGYAFFNRPIHVKHFILSGWAVVNVATITLGMRYIESLPKLITIFTGLITFGLLAILAIPVTRYLRATKGDRTLIDNWNPGIPPVLLYLSAAITTPAAFYIAFVIDKPILWPDIPYPYAYVVIIGMILLALIGFLPAKWKTK